MIEKLRDKKGRFLPGEFTLINTILEAYLKLKQHPKKTFHAAHIYIESRLKAPR